MKLKRLLIIGTAFVTAALSGMADDTPVPQRHVERVAAPVVHEETLFRADETSLDLFGTYTAAEDHGRFKDGFGGGLGVDHFFTKYIGIGLDAYAWNGDRPRDAATAVVDGSLIGRYPIESMHLAPYIFGGVGGIFTKSTRDQVGEHVGLGLEYRFTRCWGIFADARYEFVDRDNNYWLPRLGVRFTF